MSGFGQFYQKSGLAGKYIHPFFESRIKSKN